MEVLLKLLRAHLTHVHSGKVRETFSLGVFNGEELLLVVATDRVSVFDFILGCTIKDKGAILTAMNIFWRLTLQGFTHDLVAYGSAINEYLPKELRNKRALQIRAIVVRKLEMLPIECIARGFLTGSGWRAYEETGPNHVLCGISLPTGFHDGSKLAVPLFTPTTKATKGHDEHMSIDDVARQFGPEPSRISRELYIKANEYANTRRVIIPDTKVEIGRRKPGIDQFDLGDEVLTPDSSRFWDQDAYEEAQGRSEPTSPDSMDKEYLRRHCKTWGINKLNPENPEHQRQVTKMVIDPVVLDNTRSRYHTALKRLAERPLEVFWRDVMHVNN
jgi:phosphoribosylaminoimidazole-succinocarboxamide synthase